MIARLRSIYGISYERTLCYMLQASEYNIADFWQWWRSVTDFASVSQRGGLVLTQFGRALYAGVGIFSFTLLVITGFCLGQSIAASDSRWLLAGIVLLFARPWLVTVGAVVLVIVAERWYVGPRRRAAIGQATRIFTEHPGQKIAVLGSYGKTTMKELLATVLAEGKTVAASPATKNVAVSHAAFAQTLTGNEDVIILEFGEGRPGDTKYFCDLFQPNWAVVTGLAPAHLNAYGSVTAVLEDFTAITQSVNSDKLYVNGDSPDLVAAFAGAHVYGSSSAAGWKPTHVTVSAQQLTFTAQHKKRSIKVVSQLLGRHQVGPLLAVIAVADKLGLTDAQIAAGISHAQPYEHRMQPRHLGGAVIIDDTYNGNIEGIKAGIALLSELPAKRKIYVTPGLVEQGDQMESVHTQIGELLRDAAFDEVVLMKNAATTFITNGLQPAPPKTKITIIDNPLEYYQNLEYTVASGDVIMMQNDLPDRYM